MEPSPLSDLRRLTDAMNGRTRAESPYSTDFVHALLGHFFGQAPERDTLARMGIADPSVLSTYEAPLMAGAASVGMDAGALERVDAEFERLISVRQGYCRPPHQVTFGPHEVMLPPPASVDPPPSGYI